MWGSQSLCVLPGAVDDDGVGKVTAEETQRGEYAGRLVRLSMNIKL